MKKLIFGLALCIAIAASSAGQGQGTAVRSLNGIATNLSTIGVITNIGTMSIRVGANALGSGFQVIDTNDSPRIQLQGAFVNLIDTNGNVALRSGTDGIEVANTVQLGASGTGDETYLSGGGDALRLGLLASPVNDQVIGSRSGNANQSGASLTIVSSAGVGTTASGGNLTMNAGNSRGVTAAGEATVQAGWANDAGGTAGNLNLWAGRHLGGGSAGSILFGNAASTHAAISPSGVISGNGAGLTNLIGATNFSSSVTYNFNGKVTFNSVSYNTNLWAGPTNTLVLTTNYQDFITTTDCNITNVGGQLAGQNTWTTLTISNASAGDITVRSTAAGIRPQGASTTAALVIGAGKEGILSYLSRDFKSTNYVTTAQQ